MNEAIRQTYFEECEDLLESLADGLAALAAGAADAETVHALFRAVHSIKGGAGAFKLAAVAEFSHTFETVLDRLRADALEPSAPLVALLQRAADHLADLVAAARAGAPAPARPALHDELAALLGTHADAPPDELAFEPVALDLSPERPRSVRFTPTPALFANGHEPLHLFDALAGLAPLDIEADTSALAPLAAGWEAPDVSWTLETTAPEPAIRDVFAFTEGLCRLDIAEPPEPGPPPPAAEAPLPPAPPPPRPTLRVDLDRVDRMMNVVGELIINQAVLSQRIDDLGLSAGASLSGDLEDYRALARDLQEGVMAIRAQPVKPLFSRMSRIVREAATATGKDVRLVTEGAETEIDKTVVDSLADPLTHMIRNAIDHGIEPPERRVALGKPPAGTLRLTAAHRAGAILLEIADDGAGLDRPRIRAAAEARGLVSPEADLTDAEIDNLLFLPGFSTSSVISSLSGRGVGMDVVKTAIAALGGRVSIATRPGAGTTFSITLPLTLAVLDGMIVTIAGQTMVVPIATINETVRAAPADLHKLGADGRLLRLRGRHVPVVDAAAALGLPPPRAPAEEVMLLLCDSEARGLCALAVERIWEQRQVVIKSLTGTCGHVPGLSAATILGDGRIAFILDPEALVAEATLPATPPKEPAHA
ncbi:Chemotaxis histidine protein kinase [Oceanicola granulosus HTCC2516]|uniref:Chemotaxis protein CheA n=1 Tax=Oceanicola granulosus (strain ATCC BAA-861 / DSM 15982 / KCTC 12143 / HTCC2516) TaxID=314256 RepID=Q2CIR9_OCEGH|nr:chemotaxis protein CheA [Oceanicola granulosus]EAR52520.1 Chemotaxis histidine protein kinase [Oceanicola granulosus HTCC2516]